MIGRPRGTGKIDRLFFQFLRGFINLPARRWPSLKLCKNEFWLQFMALEGQKDSSVLRNGFSEKNVHVFNEK